MRTPASVGLGAGYTEGIPEGSTPTLEFSGRARRQKTVLSLEQVVPPPRAGRHESDVIAPSTAERARAMRTPILEATPVTLRPKGGASSPLGVGLPSPPTPVITPLVDEADRVKSEVLFLPAGLY